MQPVVPTKSIVFVDNAEEYWELDGIKDMSVHADRVDFIHVKTAIHPNSVRDERKYIESLAKMGNIYAKLLLKNNTPLGGDYSREGGLSKSIADALVAWSSVPSDTPKYALFDWDGTISAVEGFYLEPFYRKISGGTKKRKMSRGRTRKSVNNVAAIIDSQRYTNHLSYSLAVPPKKFLDDFFVYLMRPERIEFLRSMFSILLRNGVKVHIFTQNPYASKTNPYRKMFIEAMRRLFRVPVGSLEAMLHSTMDYTKPGENYIKSNIFRGIGL